MYTGIVTHQGEVVDVQGSAPDEVRHLVIAITPTLRTAVVGSSVSIQGTCLTVTEIEPDADGAVTRYHFDAIPETLRLTNLGRLVVGDTVNIEGSLAVGDEIGGHWVQGHVDGMGTVVAVERTGTGDGDVRMGIEVEPELAEGILAKGSITVDGVSLTVGEVSTTDAGTTRFNLYLIPHTLAITTLGQLAAGDLVNIERDVMGRWVAHHVEAYLAGRISGGLAGNLHQAPVPTDRMDQ